MNDVYLLFLAITNDGLFRVNVPEQVKEQFLKDNVGELKDQDLMATELEFNGSGLVDGFQRMFAFYGKSEVNVNAFCNGFEYAFNQIGGE